MHIKLRVGLGMLLAGVAWAGEENRGSVPPETAPRPASVAAKVNEREITMQALEERMRRSRAEEMSVYWLRRGQLQQMIRELVLQQEAQSRGITKEALVAEVTESKRIPISEAEVEEFYQEHEEVFPEGKDAAKEKISGLIREEKTKRTLDEFIGGLGTKARVAIFLPPPYPPVEENLFARLMLPRSGQGFQQPAAAAPPGVVAAVNGVRITATALDEQVQGPLSQVGKLREELRKKILERMINEVLVEEEAKKRKLSSEELFETVTHAGTLTIPDEQVESIYQQLKQSEAQGEEQTLKDQIKRQLRRRRVLPQWRTFLDSLKAKAAITMHLDAPPQS